MRKNPWQKKNEEIEALKRKLQEQKELEMLRPFVDAFLKSLGTILAFKPYNTWPAEAKTAFEWNAKETPILAQMYLNRQSKL